MGLTKKLKKYGNSLIITFDKEDIERYGLVEGDWIEISDMLVQENKRVSSNDSNSRNKKKSFSKGG